MVHSASHECCKRAIAGACSRTEGRLACTDLPIIGRAAAMSLLDLRVSALCSIRIKLEGVWQNSVNKKVHNNSINMLGLEAGYICLRETQRERLSRQTLQYYMQMQRGACYHTCFHCQFASKTLIIVVVVICKPFVFVIPVLCWIIEFLLFRLLVLLLIFFLISNRCTRRRGRSCSLTRCWTSTQPAA
jgi:hypothetical protein